MDGTGPGLRFLCSSMAALLLAAAPMVRAQQPMHGVEDPDFAAVDRLAQGYLERWGQPGVSVVIAHADRIIYAKGYGWADREARVPTSPWLEYRLASVSKTFTATAVMRLVEQGRVQLDAPAWNYVAAFMAADPVDARLRQVTVRQLLAHSWGLDRAVSADPMGGWYSEGGRILSSCKDVLRYRLLRMTLDFAPGTRYAYNNTGYCWLGLIAETLDGRPLDVQLTALLGPEALATGRVRMGSPVAQQITPDEPHYYDRIGAPLGTPVPGLLPPPAPTQVPRPYGVYALDGYAGAGGLVASPLTVTRFVQRLVGARQPALLGSAAWQAMQTPQVIGDNTPNVGLGIQSIRAWPDASDRWYSFSGHIVGTRTGWVATPRFAGGPMVTIVATINGNRVWPGDGQPEDNLHAELIFPILSAVDAIGRNRYSAKPEITGERLVAWGSTTEAWLADRVFDWGQRTYPQLLAGAASSGVYDGYRYRFYPATGVYVGVREGRLYFHQPAADPQVVPLGALADYLPAATQDPGIR